MSEPLDVDGCMRVHLIARGVDVRAEFDEAEPPQVHVYLYFDSWGEVLDAIKQMATALDWAELGILIDDLTDIRQEKEKVWEGEIDG